MESMEGLILNLWSLSTGSRIENILKLLGVFQDDPIIVGGMQVLWGNMFEKIYEVQHNKNKYCGAETGSHWTPLSTWFATAQHI